MKAIVLICTVLFSHVLFAGELKMGDYYKADEMSKLMSQSYSNLVNQNCLKEYLKSSDYQLRMKDNSKMRSVYVCSRGSYLRVDIHFDQMGGDGIGSINKLLQCDLKTPLKIYNCIVDY